MKICYFMRTKILQARNVSTENAINKDMDFESSGDTRNKEKKKNTSVWK